MPKHLTQAGKYKKGANYEREIVNRARERGCISFRSAGSHSLIDVVIIDIGKNASLITFLQCKKGKYTDTEKLKLENELRKKIPCGFYNVQIRVV